MTIYRAVLQKKKITINFSTARAKGCQLKALCRREWNVIQPALAIVVFLQFYKRARTINREFQRGNYADTTPVDFSRCQTPAKRVIDDRAPLKYCLKWRTLSPLPVSPSLRLSFPQSARLSEPWSPTVKNRAFRWGSNITETDRTDCASGVIVAGKNLTDYGLRPRARAV